MAPYCAIPRDYLSNTPLLRAMGFLVSQYSQLGAIPPPPFLSVSPLGEHAKGGCDTPPPLQRGISAILARYPMKTRQMGAIPPSAILSRKVLRDMGGYLALGRVGRFAQFAITQFGWDCRPPPNMSPVRKVSEVFLRLVSALTFVGMVLGCTSCSGSPKSWLPTQVFCSLAS